MQALILAAGRGNRLRPVTDYVPKPLIPFFGKPFLMYTLEHLVGLVDEVILVVHYKAGMFRQQIGETFGGIPIRYVDQGRIGGTGDALLAARKYLLSGRFLVILGDVLPSSALLERMMNSGGDVVLALAKVEDPENHLGVDVEGTRVTGMFTDGPWVDRGVWMLSSEVLGHLEAIRSHHGELRAMQGVDRMVQANAEVRAVLSEEPWVQLGDHAPLESVLDTLWFLNQERVPDLREEKIEGCVVERASVDVAMKESCVQDAVVFGPGELAQCVIERSLVYCRGRVCGRRIQGRVDVLG